MLMRVRLASAPLRSRLISTSETVTPAFLTPSSHRRPTYSAFRSPTSAWKDRLRAATLAQKQRRQRSPFVQQQYQRFLKQHPEVSFSRRPTHGQYFAPGIKRPVPLHEKPTSSYLKARLLKQNDPHATARRNSLLLSQRLLPAAQKLSVRVIRRHNRRKAGLATKPRLFAGRLPSNAYAVRVAAPKRLRVGGLNRFSRRRQI